MNQPRHRYCVYGIVVVSDAPLALAEHRDGGLAEVEIRSAPASAFQAAAAGPTFDAGSDTFHRYASPPDGSTYVRWETVGEFLVAADGRSIVCRSIEGCSPESFQVYMLGQALSFALVKQGFEPLHAAVVVVGDQAVAFLGQSGFGKSSLAACFLQAGYRLLTDDLLLLQHEHDRVLAYPGPPRIKLFAKTAGRFLDDTAHTVPMNGDTTKRVLRVEAHRRWTVPAELTAIYSLAAPRDACRSERVSSEVLARREGFVELVKATFNRRVVSPERLARQFDVMTRIADLVPVRRLAYPRTIDRLQEVRDLVLADLGVTEGAAAAHVV